MAINALATINPDTDTLRGQSANPASAAVLRMPQGQNGQITKTKARWGLGLDEPLVKCQQSVQQAV